MFIVEHHYSLPYAEPRKPGQFARTPNIYQSHIGPFASKDLAEQHGEQLCTNNNSYYFVLELTNTNS